MNHEALRQRAAALAGTPAHIATEAALNRRGFITFSGAGAFALGLAPLASSAPAAAADAPAPAAPAAAGLKPNQMPGPFVAIAKDGAITVQVNRLDFGQGVATSLPMLVAEEMDADFARVQGVLAPAGAAYADPMFGMQMTGGSSSVANSWLQYRELGARCRAMLVAAAAKRFGVPADQLKVSAGVVSGPGGKRASFGSLAAAAMAEPVPEKVTLKAAADFKLLGRPQPRKNARTIVTGGQGYGIDFGVDRAGKAQLPGMKTVLVARPPVFGGKVAKFDAAAARAVKGVSAVFEVETDRGGRGVAVVANGYWAAKQGRDALAPQWNSDGLQRVDSGKQRAEYQALGQSGGRPSKVTTGVPFDAAKLAGAARRISAEYSFPYLAHAPMEPLNCVIDVQGEGAATRCRVWAGTQFQTVDQGAVAANLGLKPEQVEVNTLMAGGGFGRRAVPSSDYLGEAARIAKAWRASGGQGALKVMWSREDDIHGGYYRPSHLHRAEIGLDASGRVLAWQHRIVGQSILIGTPFEPFMVKDGIDNVTVEGVADSPYALPLALDVHHPQQNVPVLWWRSVGHTHTAFVMETLIDELAQAAGQDTVAYRRALWGGKHPRHEAALALAVERSGYGKTTLPAGRAWGVAVHESFGSVVAYVVEASVKDKVPKLERVTAGVHCNFAVNPLAVEAQVQGAALMGLSTCLPGAAITLKDGVVEQGNFGDFAVPRITDMPAIAVHIVPSADAPTGMGEPGLPPLAPAFANAVARLTGQRLRELPFKLA
jgi:isoquinoline 1-oxidoreductase beta subunit